MIKKTNVKTRRGLIKESADTDYTVTLPSCANNEDEVEAFKRMMADNYNVEATFYDGGMTGSSWTLSGKGADLKEAIDYSWLAGESNGLPGYTIEDMIHDFCMDEDDPDNADNLRKIFA